LHKAAFKALEFAPISDVAGQARPIGAGHGPGFRQRTGASFWRGFRGKAQEQGKNQPKAAWPAAAIDAPPYKKTIKNSFEFEGFVVTLAGLGRPAPVSRFQRPPMKKLKLIASALVLAAAGAAHAETTLLNASYDVTREFYRDYNAAFIKHYKQSTGQDIRVDQSHAGSSTQARAVADGLEADVVTMNTTTDVDFLAAKGAVAADWQKQFPHEAAPNTSTMLFLVRKGNPKNIKDWDDLTRPDVKVVVVNPKTGGNGRMAYLAAWGQARAKGGDDAKAADFVARLYKNVPALARGGRDATGMFLQRNVGDVLITFESEVVSVEREFGKGRVEVVYPWASIVTENPVAVVERTVKKKGTAAQAKAYLDYLYSDEGQEIAAKHGLRPRNADILKKHADTFKNLKLFTVKEYFGSLGEAQKVHFNDGGQFDKLYQPAGR
jgi:sulfate ABC transporter, sulfate-binding protein